MHPAKSSVRAVRSRPGRRFGRLRRVRWAPGSPSCPPRWSIRVYPTETRRRPNRLLAKGAEVKILVVEDDVRLAEVIRRGLTESGHVVDVEHDGEGGESTAAGGEYDALILDVMLPRKDGLRVARALRDREVQTPILMLTSADTVEDTIRGL